MESVKPGTVLVSNPNMLDMFFNNSVILILRHDENGTIGINIAGSPVNDEICCGGPIEGFGFVLHKLDEGNHETSDPLPGTEYGIAPLGQDASNQLQPQSLINLPGSTCLYGYAGWSPGQLADEARMMGSWEVSPKSLSQLISLPVEGRWELAAEGIEFKNLFDFVGENGLGEIPDLGDPFE